MSILVQEESVQKDLRCVCATASHFLRFGAGVLPFEDDRRAEADLLPLFLPLPLPSPFLRLPDLLLLPPLPSPLALPRLEARDARELLDDFLLADRDLVLPREVCLAVLDFFGVCFALCSLKSLNLVPLLSLSTSANRSGLLFANHFQNCGFFRFF